MWTSNAPCVLFYHTLCVLTTFVTTLSISYAICSPYVAQHEAATVTLLSFRYPLESLQIEETLKLLEQAETSAIFYVNATDFNVKTEGKVGLILRHWHTTATTRCDTSDELLVEMALGFHLPISIDTAEPTNTNVEWTRRLLTLQSSKITVLENDLTNTQNVTTITKILTLKQLECMFNQTECAVTAYGETRYRSCRYLTQEYHLRTGHQQSIQLES